MATAIEFENVGKQYRYAPDTDECVAIFIASCIESAAAELGVSSWQMYDRMNRIGLIDNYIIPCYEVLHADSRKNITADIIKTLNIWETKNKGK